MHGGGSLIVSAKSPDGRPVGLFFGSPNDCCAAMIPGKITRSCSSDGLYVTRDLTDRGEVRQQYRQRRLHLIQKRRNLLCEAGSALQDRTHLRVVLRELLR